MRARSAYRSSCEGLLQAATASVARWNLEVLDTHRGVASDQCRKKGVITKTPYRPFVLLSKHSVDNFSSMLDD